MKRGDFEMDSNIEKLNFKREISNRYNIPIDLLDGDTVEEDYSKALALISYKEGINLNVKPEGKEETPEERKQRITQEVTPKRRKSTSEQFTEWMNNNF